MIEAEQVVDDFKPFIALRVIDPANIHQAFALAVGVVAQKDHHPGHGGTLDADRQLTQGNRALDHLFMKRLGNEIT